MSQILFRFWNSAEDKKFQRGNHNEETLANHLMLWQTFVDLRFKDTFLNSKKSEQDDMNERDLFGYDLSIESKSN